MVLSASANPAYIDLREGEAIQVYATADTFYSGGLIEMDHSTGFVSPLGTGTGPVSFYGVCNKSKTFASGSTSKVSVDTRSKAWKSVTVTGVTDDGDVGKIVYATSDDISSGATLTYATSVVAIGRVYAHVSGTTCHIRLFTPTEAYDFKYGSKNIEIGQVITDLTMDENDLNMLWTCTTADCEFTLPAPAVKYTGMWAKFVMLADFELKVTSGTADTMVILDDATADSVAFTTASEQIGGMIECICTGTAWIAIPHNWSDGALDQTLTTAT